MKLACSPFDRSEMQRLTRYAKSVRRQLADQYGDANFSSGIVDVSPADRATASYEVTVPARLVLTVWAALRRRRLRRYP